MYTTTLNSSNIVHIIGGKNCNLIDIYIYNGQTSQYLSSPAASYKSDTKLQAERCVLAQHALNNNYIFNCNNAKILHKEIHLNKHYRNILHK